MYSTSMSKAPYSPSVLVIMIGVLIMTLSFDVSAQPTVDDEVYCQSSTSDETVKQIRADVRQVKNLLESRQFSATDSSSLSNCIPLLIQQNRDGLDFFNRSWAEYKVGFNNSKGYLWLGNEMLHQLTTSGRYKLRFDLQARNGSWYYAEYNTFVVHSEAYNYRIRVSGYSGNAGALGFGNQDGEMFGTYDRDNDPYKNPAYNDKCAVLEGGGFWYNGCTRVGVNAVGWHFFWWPINGTTFYLQTSRMWLTC